MEKTKVAVLGSYPLKKSDFQGGGDALIIDLINELRGHDDLDVHMITFSDSVKNEKVVGGKNLTLHYLPEPKLPKIIVALTYDQYRLIRKLKELKPDIVHAQATAPLYAFPASLMAKKYKTLVTVHGIVQEESKTWRGFLGKIKGGVYGWMERYALRNIPYVTVLTPYVESKVKPFCNGEIHVIPQGISRDYFIESNEKKNRLLFVGGIEPRKGLLNLVKAIPHVKEKYQNIRLHVVGRARKTAYLKEIEDFIKKHDLGENIKFLGFVDDQGLKKEYSECSIFTIMSEEESQCRVLLEAMAAGKPIVAANRAALPYTVDDNETGFLVEPNDSFEVAEKIIKLLEDDTLRYKMGEKGLTKAKGYSEGIPEKRIYKLYKQIIK